MEHEKASFGTWLFETLQQRGWSVSEFAHRLNVRPSTVSRWANDARIPEPEYCVRIAHALRVDPDVVLAQAGHRPLPESDALAHLDPEVRWYFMNYYRLTPEHQRMLKRQLRAYYEELEELEQLDQGTETDEGSKSRQGVR